MSDDTRIHFSKGKYPMKKKLILLVALLSGISIVAMEKIKETAPALKDTSHGEAQVKICLIDVQSSEARHEVEIPVRLAKLIGAFNEFVEDSHFDQVLVTAKRCYHHMAVD